MTRDWTNLASRCLIVVIGMACFVVGLWGVITRYDSECWITHRGETACTNSYWPLLFLMLLGFMLLVSPFIISQKDSASSGTKVLYQNDRFLRARSQHKWADPKETVLCSMPVGQFVHISFIMKALDLNYSREGQFLNTILEKLVDEGKISIESRNGSIYYKRRE